MLDAEGQPLSVAQIAARLQALLGAKDPCPQYPVPVLTSEDRDRWAEAREQMEVRARGPLWAASPRKLGSG